MNAVLRTVNLEVSDPQRSKRLYVEVLGLKENPSRSHPPGFVYLESAAGHLTLATRHGDQPQAPSSSVELGFEVDAPESLRAGLAAFGVPAESQSMGWGQALEFHDLDGHRIVAYALRERS